MITTFRHSEPVPSTFRLAAKLIKQVEEGKGEAKSLILKQKHANLKKLYVFVAETLKRKLTLEKIIEQSRLLLEEPRFNPWLAKVLIYELLWGKNNLPGNSKPILTVRKYENKFREISQNIKNPSTFGKVSKPRYVRVNTLRISVADAIDNFREEGWIFVPFHDKYNYDAFIARVSNLGAEEFMLDIHVPELLIFPPKTEFFKHEAYKTGRIFLQDKASCLPVTLLNPEPGSTVVDTCAAPGMKTTQLAATLKNQGTVYAVELDQTRGELLKEMVSLANATCVKIIMKDSMKITDQECGGVDYLLVDPSCTGSGLTDRIEIENGDIFDQSNRVKKLTNFQSKLLRHTLYSFPKAKRIVYSTCSINPEENEDVVRQVLEMARSYKLIDARKLLPCWNNTASDAFPEIGKLCLFASPEKDKTNGFFIAVFERLGEGEVNQFLNIDLCKLFAKKSELGELSQELENIQKKKKHQNSSGDGQKVDDEKPAEANKKKVKRKSQIIVENETTENYNNSKMLQENTEVEEKKKSKKHSKEKKLNKSGEYLSSEIASEDPALNKEHEALDPLVKKHKRKENSASGEIDTQIETASKRKKAKGDSQALNTENIAQSNFNENTLVKSKKHKNRNKDQNNEESLEKTKNNEEITPVKKNKEKIKHKNDEDDQLNNRITPKKRKHHIDVDLNDEESKSIKAKPGISILEVEEDKPIKSKKHKTFKNDQNDEVLVGETNTNQKKNKNKHEDEQLTNENSTKKRKHEIHSNDEEATLSKEKSEDNLKSDCNDGQPEKKHKHSKKNQHNEETKTDVTTKKNKEKSKHKNYEGEQLIDEISPKKKNLDLNVEEPQSAKEDAKINLDVSIKQKKDKTFEVENESPTKTKRKKKSLQDDVHQIKTEDIEIKSDDLTPKKKRKERKDESLQDIDQIQTHEKKKKHKNNQSESINLTAESEQLVNGAEEIKTPKKKRKNVENDSDVFLEKSCDLTDDANCDTLKKKKHKKESNESGTSLESAKKKHQTTVEEIDTPKKKKKSA